MTVIPISSLSDDRVCDYRNVRDAELLTGRGLFMAEGRLVVRTLLESSRLAARSVFVTEPALESLRDLLEPIPIPVYLASQGVMDGVVGFHIHRGALAAGLRPSPVEPISLVPPENCSAPSTVVVLEDLSNHDNVGGLFRCAGAFGADAVLLSPRCCDPLYRKSIRVSMGAALRVPFATFTNWPAALGELRGHRYAVVALTPEASADDMQTFARNPARPKRIALMLGAEGPGLSPTALSLADFRVRINMSAGVDSLNVTTAGAIALHELSHARSSSV